MTGTTGQRIAIVQRLIPHYRVEMFNFLAADLARDGIKLTVFAGAAQPQEGLSDSREQVACCRPVRNRYLPAGMWWQPLVRELADYDLVILEQANGALINYPTLLLRAFRGNIVAFWGHGTHFQAGDGFSFRKTLKNRLLRAVDYWFAYTSLSRDIVAAAGFPPERITTLENSQRTETVLLTAQERAGLREEIGIGQRPMAVFCGRLVPQKAIGFLLDACRSARGTGIDLQLALVGGGALEDWIKAQAEREPWIHPLGPRYGTEKARLLAAADVFAMPATIGLSILDAFAAGLPVAVADFANHSPEIVYLTDGVNGIVTPATAEAYGAGLARLILDEEERLRMSAAARATAQRYTVENMARNFAAGIERALSLAPRTQTTLPVAHNRHGGKRWLFRHR